MASGSDAEYEAWRALKDVTAGRLSSGYTTVFRSPSLVTSKLSYGRCNVVGRLGLP